MKSLFSHGTSVPLVLLAAGSPLAIAAPPAASAYFTDAQTSHVQDATSQSIGQVNMITCVFHSMRPDALVNQGAYVALIDKNKCDAAKESSAANSGDSSGASQAPQYMTAVVNSTRASNTAPMLVSAWISIDEDGTPVTVFAHLSATAAPSTTDPYGTFRLDYCGKAAAGAGSCLMNGYMQAGNGTLGYYETDSGGGGGSQVTALALSSVGTASGSGSLNVSQSFNNASTSGFDFAYNSSYFLRSDGSNNMCFSRDASDPNTGISVWRYGLYDSVSGDRITRNSGFPIQYTSGGTNYQGYVGYYGLSSQAGAAAPADGSTVAKIDYQNGSASTASYAVVNKGGRLTRFTRQNTTLKLIDQIHFNAFIGTVAGSSPLHSNTQYELYWNDGSGQFIAVNEMQCGPSGCQTLPLDTPIAVDPTFWSSASMGIQGWSQSLGGDLFIDLANTATPVDATAVAYHVQDLVYPDDSSLPSALHCVSNCPTADSLHTYLAQGSGTSPYISGTYNSWQPTTAPVTYALSGNVLIYLSAPVVDTAAADYQGSQMYQNGVMSGRLVENLTDAQCGTDQNGNPQYCDWKMAAANVYYQWQTGPNSWDQFTAIKGSNGDFVHFEAPLNVAFKVPANSAAGAPYGAYANTNLILQYGGFGDLWGIPGNCVSSLTNLTVDCNDPSGDARYVAAFAIPYDPTATAHQGVVTTSTKTYLVKWLDREIRFAQEPASTCSNAGLSTSHAALPDSSGLQNPSDSSSGVYNGVEPTPTNTAPRVIQGEVMY
ncbi:MAG: hypothetical protein ACJ8R9_29830 [Steroidobacteraceae bacterium]